MSWFRRVAEWAIDIFLGIAVLFHPVMWANFSLIVHRVTQVIEPNRLLILVPSTASLISHRMEKMVIGLAHKAT